jgi:hypothetical protein
MNNRVSTSRNEAVILFKYGSNMYAKVVRGYGEETN